MQGRGAVDFTFSFATTYHGSSISAQSFEFFPHLAELNYLDSKPTYTEFWISLQLGYLK